MLASVHAAESFTVNFVPIDNSIFIDEVAEFEITIRNLGNVEDTFLVFSNDPEWLVYYEGSQVRIGSREEKTIRLILDPTRSVQDGRRYNVPLSIRSNSFGGIQTILLPVLINSEQNREFQPSIFTDIFLENNGRFNPQDPVQFRVSLLNRNPLAIDELEVRVRSPLFEETFFVALPPNDNVRKILVFDVDPLLEPQSFFITVDIFVDGRSVGSTREVEARIITNTPSFSRQVVRNQQSRLFSEYEVILTNEGNVVQSEVVEFEVGRFARHVLSTNIETELIERNGVYVASFDVQLAPGQSTNISYVINYRQPLLVLLLIVSIIVLFIFGYYVFRSPIIISKRIDILQSDEEITRAKVILNIKNRTRSPVSHIHVIERVPHITEVSKEFEVGTLEPTKVLKSPKKGTFIRWDFATLEPYEERLITYKINSKLSIVGDIKLPPTTVRFEQRSHKRTIKENKIESDDLVD